MVKIKMQVHGVDPNLIAEAMQEDEASGCLCGTNNTVRETPTIKLS